MRKGFTLVECALAGAILCIASVALLKGVAVATRIATENAQILAADGVAWDAVWKTFNESYSDIAIDTNSVKLVEAAAPQLYIEESEAVLTIAVTEFRRKVEIGGKWKVYPMKCIYADVAWGPPGERRRLSDYHDVFVYRSDVGRVKK